MAKKYQVGIYYKDGTNAHTEFNTSKEAKKVAEVASGHAAVRQVSIIEISDEFYAIYRNGERV